MPAQSIEYFREVGQWLSVNGESIYGTTHSPIPDQPWGVATAKPERLFLHVFVRPYDSRLLVPEFSPTVKSVHLLGASEALQWEQRKTDVMITLPRDLPDARDTVVVVEHGGALPDAWQTPSIISQQFGRFPLEAARAKLTGQTSLKSVTNSRYFGNWKHDTCAIGMTIPSDRVEFSVRITEPGDYRVSLEYACPAESKGREGVIEFAGKALNFETLATTQYDSHQPLMLVQHAIGIVRISPDLVSIAVHPKTAMDHELFWLRRIILEPVR
jgi:alpha-L-fucosidase